MAGHHHYDEDDAKESAGKAKTIKDFDCPECNANNPAHDEAIRAGDEVRCNYCGEEFKVFVSDEGKVKLKSL